jgi:subtilisin family serine protease
VGPGERGWLVARNPGDIIPPITALAGIDIGAPAAWELTMGSASVVVGVIDTGIRPEHPDFRGRTVAGHNFVRYSEEPFDGMGHGTHVASIIAAAAGDGVGMAGVAPGVRIMPLKVLDDRGMGTAEELAHAIRYAASARLPLVNMSLGGGRSYAVTEAMEAATDTLFVLAAGNGNDDVDLRPGELCHLGLDNVLCVGAMAPDGTRADFSNRGAATVDVFAPGVGVLGAVTPRTELARDDFETPEGEGWSLAGGWERVRTSGGHAVAAVPARYDGLAGNEIRLEDRLDEDPYEGTPVWGCRVRAEVDIRLNGSTDGLVLRESTVFEEGSFRFVDEARTAARVRGPVEFPIQHMAYFGQSEFRLAVDAGERMTADEHAVVDDVQVLCNGGRSPSGPDDHAFLSGTSMAAPHVAGIAALALSARPGRVRPS